MDNDEDINIVRMMVKVVYNQLKKSDIKLKSSQREELQVFLEMK